MTKDTADIVERARAYAIECHRSTGHEYDGQPYEVHLGLAVAAARRFAHLLKEQEREIAIAGAWVHDVIEDTRQTWNDVARATSPEVAEIAYALTNEKGRTRKERANARYYAGIRADPVAVFTKICDRIANVEYSARSRSRMLAMYRGEQAAFRAELFDPRFAEMFEHLEALLGLDGA